MSLWIKEEVGPVWIRLHVSELKKLPQTQNQDLLTDLPEEGETGSQAGLNTSTEERRGRREACRCF